MINGLNRHRFRSASGWLKATGVGFDLYSYARTAHASLMLPSGKNAQPGTKALPTQYHVTGLTSEIPWCCVHYRAAPARVT